MTKKNLDPFAIENLRLTGNEQFLKSVKKEAKIVIRKAPREMKVNEAKLIKAAPALLLALNDTVYDLRCMMYEQCNVDPSSLSTAEAVLRSVTGEDDELIAKLFGE